MRTQARAGSTSDLDWLRRVLWPDASLVRVSPDRAPAQGFRRVWTFGVIPNARRPRLLVPLTPRAARRGAFLQFNNGMTQRARLTRALAGTSLSLCASRVLVRDRLHVDVARHLNEEDLDAILPERHLASVLERPGVAVAITFGSLRPTRKPVLQIIDPDGSVVAYAKVGWNELTRELVANEASALRRWAAAPPSAFEVPTLMHHGPWGGRDLTVTHPFESRLWRRGALSMMPPGPLMREVVELGGVTTMRLVDTPMWSDVRRRVSEAAPGTTIGEVAELASRFEQDFGTLGLDVGTWHGDWAPWNMTWTEDRLAIWDWERCRDGVPIGLDVAHFAFQVTLARTGRRHVEAAERAAELGEPALRSLGVDPGLWMVILSFYLFELFLRYEEATAAGVLGTDDQIRRGIVSAISATAWERRS